jgi:DNA-binding transcriptional ArsR family regulator
MQEKDIEQSFRTYNYNTKEARTVLNRLYDENDSPVESKKLKKTKAWRLSGNKVKKKSTVSKYLKTVTPEEICRYEGMIEGCNLLIKAGMTRAVRQGKKRVDGLIGLLDDNKKWMRFQSILKKLKRKLIYRQYLLEKLKKEEKNLKNTDKLKILSNLRIHINRLRDMIDKDEEQIRCSQYIYNQLQTSPWNIT